MSNYTMELRHICELYADMTPEEIMLASPDDIISAAREHVFDFQYPLYDPDHKAELESKILYHYYMREISAETPGLWKLYLARTLREIMPYYNKLYYSADLEYNPLHDVDVTRTHAGSESGNNSSSGTKDVETSGAGSLHGTDSGTSSNTRNETRAVDETVTTETETDGRGTSSKTTNTETETETETSGRGTKTSSAEYEDQSTERNAFSATPESTIQGVEGIGGDPQNNVSANFWLTDYRKITNSKNGESSASETTTNTETGHSESSGTQTETGSTTDHSETDGSAVTDRDETARITDAGTTSGTRDEATTSSGTSSEETTGSGEYEKEDEYTERVVGKQGSASYSAMILEYRETILNIDMMIIEALEPCFMNIY